MKDISKLSIQIAVAFFVSSCSCNHWSLTSDWWETSTVWRMDVCDSWLFEGTDISVETIKLAEEKANRLLVEAPKQELHTCRVEPGSLRIIEGPTTSMTIVCSQPLTGMEIHFGSTPKQYRIEINKQRSMGSD